MVEARRGVEGGVGVGIVGGGPNVRWCGATGAWPVNHAPRIPRVWGHWGDCPGGF